MAEDERLAPALHGRHAGAARIAPAVVDINVTRANDGGEAAGTGMVIASSGVVLTDNHVIANAASITVQVDGTGRTYSAHVIGYDVADDIAVVQIENAPS